MQKVKETLKPLLIMPLLLGVLLWIMLPFILGSNYLNETRIQNLAVVVLDLDGGMIGRAVIKMVQSLNQGNTGRYPYFIIDSSMSSYEEAVKTVSSVYWAAVVVNPFSSSQLQAALASPHNNTYQPSECITFVYSEGRNANVVSGRIAGFLRTLFSSFPSQFSTNLINNLLLAGDNLSRFTNATTLLSRPVSFTEINLHPISSVGTMATTILLIIENVVSFSSILALNGIITGAKLHKALKPTEYLIFLFILLNYTALLLTLCMSGVVASFQGLTDMSLFGAYWMWNYLCICVFLWNFQVIFTVVGEKAMGLVFFCYLLFNISSSFAEVQIEHVFFQWSYATPFFHALQGVRALLFGIEVTWVTHTLSLMAMMISSWILLPLLVFLFQQKHIGLWSEEQEKEGDNSLALSNSNNNPPK